MPWRQRWRSALRVCVVTAGWGVGGQPGNYVLKYHPGCFFLCSLSPWVIPGLEESARSLLILPHRPSSECWVEMLPDPRGATLLDGCPDRCCSPPPPPGLCSLGKSASFVRNLAAGNGSHRVPPTSWAHWRVPTQEGLNPEKTGWRVAWGSLMGDGERLEQQVGLGTPSPPSGLELTILWFGDAHRPGAGQP